MDDLKPQILHRFINVIEKTVSLLSGSDIDESIFSTIANDLCGAFDPEWRVGVRIIWNNQTFESTGFNAGILAGTIPFHSSGNQVGQVEIYMGTSRAMHEDGWFEQFSNTVSGLLSGLADKFFLRTLLHQNTERSKEIQGIQRSIDWLQKVVVLEDSLHEICAFLPEAWQYPEHTVIRIRYKNKIFCSDGFRESPWMLSQEFKTVDGNKGSIEVFYTREFPEADEGPFLKEERALLKNLSNLLAGTAAEKLFYNLKFNARERVKELRAINRTSRLIAENKPVDETLGEICALLPRSWQHPKHTAVRISYEDKIYTSDNFRESNWKQEERFVTIDNNKGMIEVFYTAPWNETSGNPFLKEEYDLLVNIARLVGSYLNNIKGREMYRKSVFSRESSEIISRYRRSGNRENRSLQQFFNQRMIEKQVYLDMMKFKVREILFVATLYDAYMLESEDSFFERFLGEIYQYSLFSLPRVTGATSPKEALELLETTHFDVAILMVGIDQDTPLHLSAEIKKKKPSLPVFLLLNQQSNIKHFERLLPSVPSIDKLFIWNGDSQIFFTIVKSTEDYANAANDTKIGLVRVILLVEDSAPYYSKYLQILYSIVFGQVQKLLPEAEKNELDKISKMRSRPKILHARNYEDATYLFNTYKDFMLCVISDVEFERNGTLDREAGIKFIKYVQSHIFKIPIVLQSAEWVHKDTAQQLQVTYINKNSESLLSDIQRFLIGHLGFGDFIFRDQSGNAIAKAGSFQEFIEALEKIPEESFYLHAIENQFSIWLMARGEIKLAKAINPVHIGDFKSIETSRRFLIRCLREYDEQQKTGKVLDFKENTSFNEQNIVSLASGSLGGKGRGLAFINALIYNFNLDPCPDRINIRTPVTVIIGTNEFDQFIKRNNLYDMAIDPSVPYEKLRKQFARGRLSNTLVHKLRLLATKIQFPVAVRSSSLSEDSYTQPFAGVFDTYLVPDCEDAKVFANRLALAIKMVFASVYSKNVRGYFNAIHHKVEEERMAVVIQELVGHRYGDYYYPHISGTASSFNYYPIGHMKPEEGFSMAALGLGTYVMDGWKSYRFSPRYPEIEMYSPRELLQNSQVKFFALDYTKESCNFLEHGEHAALTLLDISEAEKHGTLRHLASVYNQDNDSLVSGIDTPGPRVIDFGNILKYDYLPLAETLDIALQNIRDALGAPVEIEYAVDLSRTKNNLPSFYLLQVKPLIDREPNIETDIESRDIEKMLLYSTASVGNGEVMDIKDVIYVDTGRFDKLKTREMTREIEQLNEGMISRNLKYLLIGPGRWGSRDPLLGIPVNWPQISNARVIVETSMADYPLDASLGSHFFHNVTSMQIGYIAIEDRSQESFVRFDRLNALTPIEKTKYFLHVRFRKPLKILMDGKQKRAAVIFN